MEKNTILAVVLSSIIIMVGMFIIQSLNKNYVPPTPLTEEVTNIPQEQVEESKQSSLTAEKTEIKTGEVPTELPNQNFEIKKIVEETNLYRIVFSTAGGIATDIDLITEFDEGKPISMVLDRDSGIGTFNLAFGGTDAPYIRDAFDHTRIRRGKQIIHNFTRDYIKDNQNFTLTKSYTLLPDEYLIELIISFKTSDGKAVPFLDADKPTYTLTYGPQIGPEFEKLDGRYEVRDFVSWGPDSRNGKLKRKNHKSRSDFIQIDNVVTWAGIVGKYFAVLVNPGSNGTIITWDGRAIEDIPEPSRIQVSRLARRQSFIEDTYKFYIGPLEKSSLIRYEASQNNAFGLSGMGFQNAPRTSSWLGWLESILRYLLELFYKIVPNYGVAIILLTVLVKAILYPFTHKSYESTSKMQAIQPKIKELQARYKGDPQKLNVKTAELYKAEGVNPMGGCLPMLFQLPIFIALYGLLNRYFPLRGASFISGWISDLSAPEFIWREFSTPINLLIINIPAIRILPILYLAGQLLMTKVTQQGGAGIQSGMQQKMLTLGMPILFFFILYNMPSGLLLYWTAMNFITIAQQLTTNYIKKLKTAGDVS